VRLEAQAIASFELQDPSGASLPAFSAGSHIDVHLPNGMSRSYSLCNSDEEKHRYVVAVARDVNSRGGSSLMHEGLRIGQVLKISPPRNHFALNESADHTVLVAGGIGVTPLWCMVQRLESLGKSWELHYATRSRSHAAFLGELQVVHQRAQGLVHLHFDSESGVLDIPRIFAAHTPANTHFYCCGPIPMLDAFTSAAKTLPEDQVHVEYFKAKDAAVTSGGVQVTLAKSKKVVTVEEGKTVLDAILGAGVDIPYSCMEGICGSCEVAVLEGEPDHHDSVLSDKQRKSNKTMIVCCSGAKSAHLVLDL
jgi:vanillate O-demethylase ferredoxin subunit